MSYARFGWEGSDVYVFLDVSGHFNCCGCSLDDGWHDSTDAIVAHLRAHQAAGHHVPADTITSLEHDRAANDAWIAEMKASSAIGSTS